MVLLRADSIGYCPSFTLAATLPTQCQWWAMDGRDKGEREEEGTVRLFPHFFLPSLFTSGLVRPSFSWYVVGGADGELFQYTCETLDSILTCFSVFIKWVCKLKCNSTSRGRKCAGYYSYSKKKQGLIEKQSFCRSVWNIQGNENLARAKSSNSTWN